MFLKHKLGICMTVSMVFCAEIFNSQYLLNIEKNHCPAMNIAFRLYTEYDLRRDFLIHLQQQAYRCSMPLDCLESGQLHIFAVIGINKQITRNAGATDTGNMLGNPLLPLLYVEKRHKCQI